MRIARYAGGLLVCGLAATAFCADALLCAEGLRRLPPVWQAAQARYTPSPTPAAVQPVNRFPEAVQSDLPAERLPAPPARVGNLPSKRSIGSLDQRVAQLEAELESLKQQRWPSAIRPAAMLPDPHETAFQSDEIIAGEVICPRCLEAYDAGNEICDECEPNRGYHGLAEMLDAPRYPTVRWSGFLQLDSGWVAQDAANKATVGEVDASTGLRRVRLRVSGDLRETASYVVDLDFAAEGHPSFRDVMLRLHEIPVVDNMHFGYYQQPFGADAMTSGRELLFLERPLPFAFAPFRQTGIGAHSAIGDRRGTWFVSAYRFPTDSFGVNIGDSGGWALSNRVTYLPVYESDGELLIHTGLGYSVGDPGNNFVRYAIEPGFFVTDPTSSGGSNVPVFVDTGNIPTETFNLFNAELAAELGPLNLQSEVRFSAVDQINGPTVVFGGAYAQLGYVLTGEARSYELDRGIFHAVLPRREFEPGGGCGAWEVAVGWSYIDLNDKNIAGGRMQTLIAGLNWYLGPQAKFVFNVIRVFLDDPTFDSSQATIAAARVQAEF